LVQEHHRKIYVVQAMQFTVVKAVGEDQQTICIVLAKRAAGWSFLFCRMDQQVITRLIGAGFDALEHRWKKRAADFRENEANGICPFAGEHPRRMTRDKLKLLHGKPHPVGFFNLDGRCPIQDATHRGNRNLSLLGNISDRGWAIFDRHYIWCL